MKRLLATACFLTAIPLTISCTHGVRQASASARRAIDTKAVMQAVMREMEPNTGSWLRTVLSCEDGSFWIQMISGEGRFFLHVSANGEALSEYVHVGKDEVEGGVMDVVPLMTVPGGKLIVVAYGTEVSDPPPSRLVRVGNGGVEAVGRQVVRGIGRDRSVRLADAGGIVHMFNRGNRWPVLYEQMNGRSRDLKVETIRRFFFSSQGMVTDSFGTISPPWHGYAYGRYSTACWAGPSTILMAACRDLGDSVISLYRIELPSLRMVDSTRVRVDADCSREIRGPRAGHIVIVPSGGGSWLFVPARDSEGEDGKQSGNAAVARTRVYWIATDSGPRVDVQRETCDVRPLSDLPEGSRLDVSASDKETDEFGRGEFVDLTHHLRLDFFGYGPNGLTYFATEADSLRQTRRQFCPLQVVPFPARLLPGPTGKPNVLKIDIADDGKLSGLS